MKLLRTHSRTLTRVKLPKIRTLITPPAAHPLLRHCHSVEDVVYVVVTDETKLRHYEPMLLQAPRLRFSPGQDSKFFLREFRISA